MPATKRFPCSTTRKFNRKIHPKFYPYDYASFRLQIRKHSKVSWDKVIEILKTWDWLSTFDNPRLASKRGHFLTTSFRARAITGTVKGDGAYWTLNLSTGQRHFVRGDYAGPI